MVIKHPFGHFANFNKTRKTEIHLSLKIISHIHRRKNCHHHHYHVLQPSRFLGTRCDDNSRFRWLLHTLLRISLQRCSRLNQGLRQKNCNHKRRENHISGDFWHIQKSSVMVSCDGLFFHCHSGKTDISHAQKMRDTHIPNNLIAQQHQTDVQMGRQIAGKFVIYHMLSPAAKLT